MAFSMDWLNSFRACLTCFQAPLIDVAGRKLEMERLIGEGGFAFVYLVRDQASGRQYALKKIRCPFGGDSVANAMREVDACNAFKGSQKIMQSVASDVRQEADGSRTVLLLLPYYPGGSVQDVITKSIMDAEPLPEVKVLKLSQSISAAIAAMHHHRGVSNSSSSGESSGLSGIEQEAPDYIERTRLLAEEEGTELSNSVPYAHRDIKPANLMFSDDGEVVLMDLGSCSPARVHATTRQQALELQDMAAEHCTLPYRAPELFDVKTGVVIDEKVDIWSLGCTIYALMYGASPFEREEQVAGASVAFAASTGRYSIPDTPSYSSELKGVVKACLNVSAAERPNIDTVISMLDNIGQ